MIASTTSWIFFVLLNAYYSGALTMFFTTEIRVPFNSIEEVMKAYPDWKLKFMSGNDVFFQYKAIQVSSNTHLYISLSGVLKLENAYGNIANINSW